MKEKAISIRLPEDIYKKIKGEAEKERRSINAQVNVLIERIVKEENEKQEA